MTDSVRDSGLGLPGMPLGMPPPTNAPTAPRQFMEFTLPDSWMGADFAVSEFVTEHRTFRMVEPTPFEQQQAIANAGGKTSRISDEMIYLSIVRIGSGPHWFDPQRNRDRMESWWKAIGPRARSGVQQAFMRMSQAEADEVERFLGAGLPNGVRPLSQT